MPVFLGSLRPSPGSTGLPPLWFVGRLIPQEAGPDIFTWPTQVSRERAEAKRASEGWAGRCPSVTSTISYGAKEVTGGKVSLQGSQLQDRKLVTIFANSQFWRGGHLARETGLGFKA